MTNTLAELSFGKKPNGALKIDQNGKIVEKNENFLAIPGDFKAKKEIPKNINISPLKLINISKENGSENTKIDQVGLSSPTKKDTMTLKSLNKSLTLNEDLEKPKSTLAAFAKSPLKIPSQHIDEKNTSSLKPIEKASSQITKTQSLQKESGLMTFAKKQSNSNMVDSLSPLDNAIEINQPTLRLNLTKVKKNICDSDEEKKEEDLYELVNEKAQSKEISIEEASETKRNDMELKEPTTTSEKKAESYKESEENEEENCFNDEDDEKYEYEENDDSYEEGSENEMKQEKSSNLAKSSLHNVKMMIKEEDLYVNNGKISKNLIEDGSHDKPLKIYVPKLTTNEVFAAVLREDIDTLDDLIHAMDPQELLVLRDHDYRTIYHYAALSSSKATRIRVFHHAPDWIKEDIENQIAVLCEKGKSKAKGNSWIPPRVKELQSIKRKYIQSAIAATLRAKDRNERSWIHYLISEGSVDVKKFLDELDFECDLSVMFKLHAEDFLLSEDRFGWSSLHFAVEKNNVSNINWLFRMGVGEYITSIRIHQLLALTNAKQTHDVLLRWVEKVDTILYHQQQTSKISVEKEIGLSTELMAKLLDNVNTPSGTLLQTPLHKAAMYGNIKAVQGLLKQGAQVDVLDANGWNAFHYCAQGGSTRHIQIVDLLMKNILKPEKSINQRSLKGRTPLHIAIKKTKTSGKGEVSKDQVGSIGFVKFLHREYNADLNAKDLKGYTVLLLASRHDDFDVVSYCLNHPADSYRLAVDQKGRNALHLAAEYGHMNMAKFLSCWDVECQIWLSAKDSNGRTPSVGAKNEQTRNAMMSFWHTCWNGDVGRVKSYLQQLKEHASREETDDQSFLRIDSKTAESERTALHLTIQGYIERLEKFQAQRHKQHSSGSMQVKNGRPRSPKTIERTKNTESSRPHHIAALVLAMKRCAHLPDKWGVTALMLSATISDPNLFEEILDSVSDDSLDQIDDNGNNVLHYAYAFSQAKISSMIEERTESCDRENNHGMTPLDVAGSKSSIFPRGLTTFLTRNIKWREQVQAQEVLRSTA